MNGQKKANLDVTADITDIREARTAEGLCALQRDGKLFVGHEAGKGAGPAYAVDKEGEVRCHLGFETLGYPCFS